MSSFKMDSNIELNNVGNMGPPTKGGDKICREADIGMDTEGQPSITSGSDQIRSQWRLMAIVFALFLSLFVAALDATIVATAAPTISRELQSAAGYTWIGGAYLLANASAGPIWAKLSDIWGRKLIVLLALAMFFASSAVCASAKTMYALIVGRALQGCAGGGLILLVHVCISDLFSLRKRSLFMGLTEGIWALAGGVGPILGGVFASLVSWRWCFYINLPISGLAFLLILLLLDIQHEDTSFVDGIKAVDWFGIFTFLGFTLMILLGLDFGGAIFPWNSAKVVALLVVGGLMIFGFIYSEAKVAKHPLIPMALFKKRTNLGALLVVFSHGFTFIGAEYYMPLYFQSVLETTPLMSGILLFPLIVATAVVGVTAGIIIHKTGRFRELIWAGTAILCLGFGLFISFDARTTTAKVIGFQIVGGLGSGLLFEPPLIAVQSQVAQSDIATATSTVSFVRSIALTISIVIGGTIFQNSMDARAGSLRAVGLPASVLNDLSGKNAAANVVLGSTLTNPVWQLAVKNSFAFAMRNMWICYTVFAFLGVAAGVLIEDAHLGTEHTETVTGIKKEKPDTTITA
ncbi:MFS transporter-like protein [Clohesyomyces aquaticus]|uniref:MFS transporter-like protein n=1 Tax=Clohesyomyces aquaticus TaxID=1231657 RepID=A0A1Y2A5X4_9PLEO|nr:MFS transporter-like protein [Clohesyomyces aquaticus]